VKGVGGRWNEPKKGWPLPTVETEPMGTKGVHIKGILPWLVHWARRASIQEIFFPALAALVGPVQNILLLTVHYFTSFVPIVQQAGQAVVPHRLSLIMYLTGDVVLHIPHVFLLLPEPDN
jgi:hypothetical protein